MQEKRIVIYTKTNCPQCHMTQRMLDQAGVPTQTNFHGNVKETNELAIGSSTASPEKIAWTEQKCQELIEQGHRRMPYVKIIDPNTVKPNIVIFDEWSGFQPSKLHQVIDEWNQYHNYTVE